MSNERQVDQYQSSGSSIHQYTSFVVIELRFHLRVYHFPSITKLMLFLKFASFPWVIGNFEILSQHYQT